MHLRGYLPPLVLRRLLQLDRNLRTAGRKAS
jgi:hypothetical protein